MPRTLLALALLLAAANALSTSYTRPTNNDCLSTSSSSGSDASLFPSEYQISGSSVISEAGRTEVRPPGSGIAGRPVAGAQAAWLCPLAPGLGQCLGLGGRAKALGRGSPPSCRQGETSRKQACTM